MITEDYVNLETTKLLKKKGFDKSCLFESDIPTLQMAMKWLRNVHKIGVFPSTYTFIVGENGSAKHVYGTAIINLETYELMTSDMMPMPTYEQAAETAIKYCLENLI